MKIAVLGAGGVGGFFGARLAASGNGVGFVARGAHLDAMRQSGLELVGPENEMLVDVNADDPEKIGVASVVIFAVKLYDSEVAAQASRRLTSGAPRNR